ESRAAHTDAVARPTFTPIDNKKSHATVATAESKPAIVRAEHESAFSHHIVCASFVLIYDNYSSCVTKGYPCNAATIWAKEWSPLQSRLVITHFYTIYYYNVALDTNGDIRHPSAVGTERWLRSNSVVFCSFFAIRDDSP